MFERQMIDSADVKNVLVLFPKDWDKLNFSRAEFRDRYRFFYEGFELFTFPQNLRLLDFDVLGCGDMLAAKYRRIGLQGIVSNNEQFGALAASLLAARLGLPGLNPRIVITAQHKYYARRALEASLARLLPRFCVFPYSVKSEAEIGLPFPFFIKPVKATYSVLARRVDSFAELRSHLSFGPLEKFVIKRLVKPFNDAMRAMTEFRVDAHHLIGESLLTGWQVSVEGLIHNVATHVLGVVDAVMYPGTEVFMRWDYPSHLPPPWRATALQAADQVVTELGYDHGFFNVEFKIDLEAGKIKLIELNPRMASQFSDLYEKVEGLNLHEIAVQLSCGEAPRLDPGCGKYRSAASFVFRKFDGTPLERPPTVDKLAWLARFDPDAHLMLYLKRGRSLAREMKWLGSHRYAVLNMGAASEEELREKHRIIKRVLELETGPGDVD